MAKIISLLNHKGGVGKTTTTLNLGSGLAKLKKKVLLIDMDGQANLTSSLPQKEQYINNMYKAMIEVVKGGKYELPIYNISKYLDLSPSHIDLAAAEADLISAYGRESILESLIEPIKDKYDYILIDCPPSIGVLSINALKASNSVIIPVVPDYYGVLGLSKMTDIIQAIQGRLNTGLKLEGILFTIWDNTKIQKDARKTILENEVLAPYIYRTKIRKNVQLREAPLLRSDIFDHNPDSAGAEDYVSFIKEFLSKQTTK